MRLSLHVLDCGMNQMNCMKDYNLKIKWIYNMLLNIIPYIGINIFLFLSPIQIYGQLSVRNQVKVANGRFMRVIAKHMACMR